MSQGRAARRLANLAAQAGGSEPSYVRRPIPHTLLTAFPAEGWYWVPPGHDHEVFLGASEIDATVRLLELIHAGAR